MTCHMGSTNQLKVYLGMYLSAIIRSNSGQELNFQEPQVNNIRGNGTYYDLISVAHLHYKEKMDYKNLAMSTSTINN